MRKQPKRSIRQNKDTEKDSTEVVTHDIPCSNAEVEIRYEYKGRMVWWAGVMENVVRNNPRSEYLGRGTIIYEARDEYNREHKMLRFLPGRKVLLSGKEGKVTTWRFPAPADKDEENDGDFDGSDRRPSKKTKTDYNSTRSTITSAADGTELSPALEEMTDIAIDVLATRVTKVERMLQVKTSCNHAPVINHMVNVRRNIFRRELSLKLAQTQRTWKRSGTPFQEAIRADVEEISVKDDLQLFQHIVDDARARSHETGYNRVAVRPHWVDVKRTIRCASADVIFSTMTGLMEWLDVTSEDKIKDLCRKEWKEKGLKQMRVVGALRWSEQDTKSPMNMFCGKSVGTLDEVEGNSIPSTNTTGVETSDTLEWGSSKWDLENNCLVSRPAVKTGKVGMLCNADRRNIISISWTADKAMVS